MNLISAIADRWLGLCPKTPALRTAPGILIVPPETVYADRPDGSGPAACHGRVRQGVSIAAGSLKSVIRDRQMLWFSLLSGLLMIVLFALMYWIRTIYYDPWTRTMHYDPFLIKILLGDFILWFDLQLLLILAFCLFCFTLLMTGLILYRNANRCGRPLTIREGFAGVRTHAGPLAALSIAMALAGTILFGILSESQVFYVVILLTDAFLPNYPFLPSQIEFTILFFSTILFIYIILFLALLYVVPVIVLENKGLVPALAGSVTLIQKTWREMLGCILVYGIIVLGVAATALVISQSPSLLNYDYKFFSTQGLLPIMAVCYEFILLCFTILMAACSTAAGVAIADLYRVGKSAGISGIPDEILKKPEPEA